MKFTLKKVQIAIVILIISGISSIVSCTSKPEAGNLQQISIVEHNLSIHKFGGDVLQSLASVDGKAKNISHNIIKQASISISFFDSNGNLLQTASTIKQNWQPQEIWDFTIKFSSPDAWKTTRYTISSSIE